MIDMEVKIIVDVMNADVNANLLAETRNMNIVEIVDAADVKIKDIAIEDVKTTIINVKTALHWGFITLWLLV